MKRKTLIWSLLLTAAVLLCIIGIASGGMEELHSKASTICSECIGIG